MSSLYQISDAPETALNWNIVKYENKKKTEENKYLETLKLKSNFTLAPVAVVIENMQSNFNSFKMIYRCYFNVKVKKHGSSMHTLSMVNPL